MLPIKITMLIFVIAEFLSIFAANWFDKNFDDKYHKQQSKFLYGFTVLLAIASMIYLWITL